MTKTCEKTYKQEPCRLDHSVQHSTDSHPQPLRCHLIRFWSCKRRHGAAEHHAACDSTMWPCGLSIQMATFLSASLPVCLSQLLSSMGVIPLTAHWAPTANQHQNIETSTGCIQFSVWGVKSSVYGCETQSVFTGGYRQLIPIPMSFCTRTADGCCVIPFFVFLLF